MFHILLKLTKKWKMAVKMVCVCACVCADAIMPDDCSMLHKVHYTAAVVISSLPIHLTT